MPSHISLYVPGKPPLKRRHRHTRTGLTFTDDRTKADEARVRAAWEAKGRPTLPDGPVRLTVTFYYERPKSHYKADGSLSKQGRMFPYPMTNHYGDATNAAKAVEDALNDGPYRDDALIVDSIVHQRWAIHQPAHTAIRLEVVDVEA